MTAARRPGTQAVDRAAGLLSAVVHADGPVTCAALCRASGLPRSTASRLMLALEKNKLVRRVQNGGYVPGEMFEI
jgi:DNA-binding IclR family transcriptional regulator